MATEKVKCGFIEGCIFFNRYLAKTPATAGLMVGQYCHGDFETCARFIVRTHKGKEHVPEDMFPGQRDRAQKILRDV